MKSNKSNKFLQVSDKIIFFQSIQSHVGMKDNEQVDFLAKKWINIQKGVSPVTLKAQIIYVIYKLNKVNNIAW